MNVSERDLYLCLRKLSAYPLEQKRKTFERLQSDYFLRCGIMPRCVKNLFVEIMTGLPSFTKFNPYHDPNSGRFTSGPNEGNRPSKR